jgi:hypothetical protein
MRRALIIIASGRLGIVTALYFAMIPFAILGAPLALNGDPDATALTLWIILARALVVLAALWGALAIVVRLTRPRRMN